MKNKILFLMSAVLIFATVNNCFASSPIGAHQYIKNESAISVELRVTSFGFNNSCEFYRMYYPNGNYYDFTESNINKNYMLDPGERLTFRGCDNDIDKDSCGLIISIPPHFLDLKIALYDEAGDIQGDGYYNLEGCYDSFFIRLRATYGFYNTYQTAALYKGDDELTWERGESMIIIKDACYSNNGGQL